MGVPHPASEGWFHGMQFPTINRDVLCWRSLARAARCMLIAGMGGLAALTGSAEAGPPPKGDSHEVPKATRAPESAPAPKEEPRFYVREYRVEGARKLRKLEVEEAVYPFMGPGRTAGEVEMARQALEKAYHDKGFQTVSVLIPSQDPRRGIIRMEVVESKVARLRVVGAKWYLPSRIRTEVPSLAEGKVPDFKQVEKEIVAVNRSSDRRVTPELRPGMEPGTVEIDLKVEDSLPLHGSLELNNRYSQDTTPLRLNAALSYGNCFQAGHTAGVNIQLAPENTDDSLAWSGYYLARVSDSISLMVQGTKQNSDISSISGTTVGGRGDIIGLRALIDLPAARGFQQSFNLGMDYKNLDEDVVIGPITLSSPVEYYPLSAAYAASWLADGRFTELNTSVTLNLRGLGSDQLDYAVRRYGSSGSFIILRADAAHTHDLKNGSQLFAKVQGQLANQPLSNSEQIAAGGLSTVRGYLEATALGDNGIFGTAEFRTPSLIGNATAGRSPDDEWRFHVFADAGVVGIHDALPGQKRSQGLSSLGLGTRFQLRKHYHGSLDAAFPLVEMPNAENHDLRITFRGWIDF
jgi:hemolysin activation/secretion protein